MTKRGLLAAAVLLAMAIGCGPKVTKARLVTPTAGPRFVEPEEPTPTPAPPPAPRPSATFSAPPPPAAATPTRRTEGPAATQVPAPSPTATRAPSPLATATRVPPPQPTATREPSPQPTPTRPAALPSTATRAPSPPPTATRVPPAPPTATRAAVPNPTATRAAVPVPTAPRAPTAAVAVAMPTAMPAPSVTAAAVAAAPAGATPPARVSTPVFETSALLGEWRFRAETGDRDIEGLLRFRTEENGLVGLYVSPNGTATLLTNFEVSGNRIAWNLVTPRATWHLRGTFTDTWMNGTFQTATRTVQWTATKQSGASATAPTNTPAR